MTTRTEGLEIMALGTGEQLATVTNHSRSLTVPEVRAPYNTALGRGHRHAHMKAEWLCSTFLATALNDPKNAAWQVPACGNLLVGTPLFVQNIKINGGALEVRARKAETSIELPASFNDRWLGLTLFKVLVRHVKDLATNWNGPQHQLMRLGFSMTIVLGKGMSAELDEVIEVDQKDGAISSCRTPFSAPDTKVETSTMPPLRRKVEILLPHIEMLASLYADTLKHEGTFPPSGTAPALANAGTETKNAGSLPGEPAPSDCQPTTLTTTSDDDGTHTRTNGLHKPGSNACVCQSRPVARV